MSMRGRAAIVGIGEFKPEIYSEGATTLGMLAQVGMLALADAGIEVGEVDGLVTEAFSEAPFMGASTVAEYLCLRPTFLEQVDLGGATSGVMVARAAVGIAAGLCNTVLVVTAARRERRVTQLAPRDNSYKDRTPQGEFDVPYGATGGNWAFAMFAKAYMQKSRVTPDHLARVVVTSRYNGCHNPNAIHFGQPLTKEEYFESPVTADPLRKLDGSVSCAGASALVVTTAKRAKKAKRPVYILGSGEHHTHRSVSFADSFEVTGLKLAADQAFAMAGLRRKDMDLACIYDAFSSLVPQGLEDAGFIKPGKGGQFIDQHNMQFDGDFPVNPHGGQIAFGHTGVPAGMSTITAAARQLMGRADGHQVKRPQFAFASGLGGEMSTNVALVLGKEPR